MDDEDLIMNGADALKSVSNKEGAWTWCLLGADPEALPLAGGGSGPIEDMQECLEAQTDSAVLAGLIRLKFRKGTTELFSYKWVMVWATMDGATGMNPVKRGQAAGKRPALEKVITGYTHLALTMEITSAEDLGDVLEKVKKVTVLDGDHEKPPPSETVFVPPTVVVMEEEFEPDAPIARAPDSAGGEESAEPEESPASDDDEPKGPEGPQLVNGNFDQFPLASSWTTTGDEDQVLSIDSGSAGFGGLKSAAGNFYVALKGSGGEVSQCVLGHTSWKLYWLVFYAAESKGPTLKIYIDGSEKLSVVPPSSSKFTRHIVKYQATSADVTIKFKNESADAESAALISRVAIVEEEPSEDEPAVEEATPKDKAAAGENGVPAGCKAYVKGDLVDIWSASENKWFTDGLIEEVRGKASTSHEGKPLPAGCAKITYNSGSRGKWLQPDALYDRNVVKPSIKPEVFQGFLKKETHNIFSEWHDRYCELRDGRLTWWITIDDAKSNGKPQCVLELVKLQMKASSSTSKFSIRTASSKGVVYNFDCNVAAQKHTIEEWTSALKQHAAYSNRMYKFKTQVAAK